MGYPPDPLTVEGEALPNRGIDGDLRTVTAALIVLSGHLPLFSDDPKKVKRAGEHLELRDLAFEALDRIADALEADHPVRVHRG